MTPHRMSAALIAFGVCCTPLTALANDVPFETLGQLFSGSESSPREVVARSAAEADAKGLTSLLHLKPIDWGREMVIAVFMGEMPSTGYEIEIEQIRLLTPAGGHELEVIYRRTEPRPGQPTTSMTTKPYHVIKLQQDRGADVRFRLYDPAAEPFESLRRFRREAVTKSWTLVVEADGDVTYEADLLIDDVSLTGQATPDELARLQRAVQRARLHTLPQHLSAGQTPPPANRTTSYLIQGGTQGGTSIEGWTDRINAEHVPALADVDAALDAIQTRIAGAPAAGRTSVRGTVEVSPTGDVSVVADGQRYLCAPALTDELRRFEGLTVTVKGQVTDSVSAGDPAPLELEAIVDPAAVNSLGSIHSGPSGPTFRYGDPFIGAEPLAVIGPKLDLLELAVDHEVEVRGWLFHDADGHPEAFLIDAIGAEPRDQADIVDANGAVVGTVGFGDTVYVRELDAAGTRALVDGDGFSGHVDLDALRVGFNPFGPAPGASGPGATPPSSGMTGALGGF